MSSSLEPILGTFDDRTVLKAIGVAGAVFPHTAILKPKLQCFQRILSRHFTPYYQLITVDWDICYGDVDSIWGHAVKYRSKVKKEFVFANNILHRAICMALETGTADNKREDILKLSPGLTEFTSGDI
ncbi:hypothetical protein H0H92_000425 [Tricholoma furcatifolium]|nr:hypothetical protein H0H92_000425 [Tricholoma furcatifolium]